MSPSINTFAKLNLCLWVSPPDHSGYHPIQSIFQTIDLHDTLHISQVSEKGCTLHCDNNAVPLNHKNTLITAYNALSSRLSFGVTIQIDKRIPMGAGLGGGSSNAAGLLSYLNSFCTPSFSDQALIDLASKIGADVPYFLVGGTAYVTGYGEQITPLNTSYKQTYLLVKPRCHASTVDVYHHFDSRPLLNVPDTPPRLETHLGQNHLQESAYSLYPEIAELASCLQALSIGPVAMSGSGATLFIAVKSVTQANHWQTLIQEQRPDVWTTITHTIPEAYHIVTTPTHP